jgi:hypothetical protein
MPAPKTALNADDDDNVVEEMYREFPGLRRFGIELKDSTASSTDWRGQPQAGRKMEFYPAEESWNPNPGKPTIELFSNDMKSKDAFGEIFSHLLPKVDPDFKKARTKFVASIDAKQKEILQGDYQHQIKSGLYSEDRKPTFEQWLNTQGGDAFFRGYVSDQYPKKFYRPDQIEMFDSLLQKLKR